ncbi:MAG: bifunctional [glutamine synthetase] adenylyltransferase/[glutamine synthetase]-adenylyl-L-tyrosine phosphorylase [Parvularculaceae bacterium]
MANDVAQNGFIARIRERPSVHDGAAAGRLISEFGGEFSARFAALPEPAQSLVRAIGGASPYLSRLIERGPAALFAILDQSPEESLKRLIARADAAGDLESVEAVMRELRKAKAEAALFFALVEIAGVWSSLEAAAGLSDFTDAALNAAMRAAMRTMGPKGYLRADAPRAEEASGIAVLAMGKYGARELNFSSDIDLIVLFDAEAPVLTEPLQARQIGIATARLIVRILNEQTVDGYVFRTDLRLRPDPGTSAAAVSVRAAEAYYEAHGQNWERAAFIKARAAAGDIALGEAFLKSLRPFVWRKYLDYAAIEDIHSIKRQIHAAKGGGEIEFYGHDIKTGRGGIREIEFLAQTQQLILGGKDPALRERQTVAALAALVRAGQLSEEAREHLDANYRYLRRVEHRLQMIGDEQTHRLPRDREGAARLAAFLGEEDVDAFEKRLTGVLSSTHKYFAELFEREERLSTGSGSLIFTGVENDPGTLATLESMGFKRASDVSETIRRWHMGSVRATRSPRARELLTKLAPRLLEALSKAGDPDAAFVAFDDFLGRLPGGVQVFALFANNPHVFDILIRIMTISPYLGRELSRRRHLIEALLESGWPGPQPAFAQTAEELAARLSRVDAYEAKLNEARRWAAEHRFETAARLVTGLTGVEEAGLSFTHIADAAINAMLPAVREETERQFGPIDGALVAIGMGRLGAGTMTATSDVDIVFIYEAPEDAMSKGAKPVDAVTYYMRFVRRFITALSAVTEEGALYEVDMQLRPSGSKGPWAVSLSAFTRYYESDAWTWEEMALTKARIVAGDEALGARVRAAIDAVVTKKRDRAKLAADVEDMRRRVAEAKPAVSVWDLKTAEGGHTDLDFALAILALDAASETGVPPAPPRDLIAFLAEKGRIRDAEAQGLLTAFELFETVSQLSRAATGGVFAPDAAGEALKARMAAACDARSIAEAEEKLVAQEKAVKATYLRIVHSIGGGAKQGD